MAIKQKLMLLVTGLALSGCSPLAPRPNYTKYFVLTPMTDSSNPAPAKSNLAIGVGPIDFPGYLQRTQVVTRTAPNRIELSPIDRWGEPLDKNFKRVLSENLAQLLNTYRIEEYPWNHETKVDYQITIEVLNFETTADGQSLLRTRWIIKDPGNGRDLYATETTANTPAGPGDTGISAALSSDLAILSKAIADQVTILNQQAASASPQLNLMKPNDLSLRPTQQRGKNGVSTMNPCDPQRPSRVGNGLGLKSDSDCETLTLS